MGMEKECESGICLPYGVMDGKTMRSLFQEGSGVVKKRIGWKTETGVSWISS